MQGTVLLLRNQSKASRSSSKLEAAEVTMVKAKAWDTSVESEAEYRYRSDTLTLIVSWVSYQ